MKAYVVMEGLTNVQLITNLVPQDIRPQITVVPVGERANLSSVARTLLVIRRKPVAALVNANTVDEKSVLEKRQETEGLLRAMSGGVPFKVFMMVPEIETLLFNAPEAIERITGQQLSADNLALSRHNPRQVILQLGQNKSDIIEQIVSGLTTEDLSLIRESSPMRELIEFLSEKLAPQPQTV